MDPSDFPASLAARVRELAGSRPDEPAYLIDDRVLTWSGYDAASDRLARIFVGLGLQPGACVAVWLPDGPGFHVAFRRPSGRDSPVSVSVPVVANASSSICSGSPERRHS